MDKRALATNRARKPLYEKMGQLSPELGASFLELFASTPSSIANAVALRNSNNLQWADESQELPGYDQYDIQYPEYNQYDDPDYFFTETDYVLAKPEFNPGIEAIEKTIGGRCYRLRYSTLEPGAVLDWHMDQPTLDRFIIVLSGKQRYEVVKRGEPHHVIQEPLDVWYINASWEHRVLNMQNEIRVALLGCFVYNKG